MKEWEKDKPLNIKCYMEWMIFALKQRIHEYELTGNLVAASADKKTIVEIEKEYSAYEEKENQAALVSEVE